MKSPRLLLTGIILAASSLAAVAHQRGEDVQIKTTAVRGPVYMLEGRGGNIGVSAGPDGVLIIDDQFDYLAEKIQKAIDALGRGELKFVLNTHWHGDHTGGNKIFGRQAPIVAHENVRKRLLEDSESPAPKEALPVITYQDGISIHFNGETIRVYHLPAGHTDGDSVIYFTESNVLHMGDLFFSGRFPYIDLGSGGDVAGFLKNVDTVIDRLADDVKIIPGHGPLSTIDDLRKFRGMLRETTDLVRQRINDGKSLEEAQAMGLPEKWDSWGKEFISNDRWIEIVYTSFSRK